MALTPHSRYTQQGPDGAGDLGAEACAVHALFLILHSGNILDSGPGDANSKQADVQTLSSSFEAVTRIHFPEALGHVALRLVPCPPICAAAYALVSKYWPGVEGQGTHRVSKAQTATWGLLGSGWSLGWSVLALAGPVSDQSLHLRCPLSLTPQDARTCQ